MHVHANYSLQSESLRASYGTAEEIAARRSAEVRKKLSLADRALNEAGDEIAGVHARPDEEQQRPKHREPTENDFGSLFSARV